MSGIVNGIYTGANQGIFDGGNTGIGNGVGLGLQVENILPNAIVRNGLVLYLDASQNYSYPRSGTTWRDISGNNNNGTLTNGPTFNSENGGSIVFDGVDDFVSVSNNSTINGTSQTISVWFKNSGTYTTGNQAAEIIGKHNAVGSFNGYGIQLVNDFGNIKVSAFVKNATVNYVTLNSTQIISSLIWYNATITFTSNSQIILYLNGISILSRATGLLTNSTQPLRIGQSNDLFFNIYNGSVAQTLVYNRVLTAAEILQNYNATKSRFGLW